MMVFFFEIDDLLKQHGGVHILVDHDVHIAFEECDEPDVPLYVGWSEDLNVFGENAKVAAEGKVWDKDGWEEYTDSDLGTPSGSDEEYQNIVGAHRKKKKQAMEDERAFFEALQRKNKKFADNPTNLHKGMGSSRPKKTRANRMAHPTVSVKHTPATRKRRNAAHNKDIDPLQNCVDGNETDLEWEDDGGSGYFWQEFAGSNEAPDSAAEQVTGSFEQGAAETVGSSQQQGATNGVEAESCPFEHVATETGESSQQGAANSVQAEKEKERKRRRAETIRRYKSMYTSLPLFKGAAADVQYDERNDFGEQAYLSEHESDGDVGYSYSSSSDEGEVYQIPVQNDPRCKGTTDIWFNEDWKVPYFQVGMRFTDYTQFKRAIQKYAVCRVAGIRAIRNESGRQRYKCRPGCPFLIYAAPDKRVNCFRVKRMKWKHNCKQEPTKCRANFRYIANHYRSKIRKNPSYTCKQMMVDLFKEKGIAVRYSKCVRAKILILVELEGNFITEYAVIVGYANYLKAVNPNNTVTVVSIRKTRMPDSPRVFERMYICLDVLKDGWKKGCRRVIGIDGTHLKGICKGVLFAAVGKDGNGQMYPIAWAVVDAESFDTWSWFLKLLIADLELGHGDNLTILSDKHKGILSSVNQLLPNAEHRHCSRHFYGNLRKFFPDRELQKLFWRIVKSFDDKQFQHNMTLLRSKSVAAHDALLAHDVSRWCRAFFSSTTTFEDVTNNITESFNGWIRDARCLPVISMLEAISSQLMKRRAEFYNAIEGWEGDICPYPFKRLQKRVKEANDSDVVWDGHHSFNVYDTRYRKQHIVEMIPRTCTCGYWQLTGVPCAHVCRCCLERGWDPEDYVSPYLRKDKYILAYQRPIDCTRGPEMWEDYQGPKLEPPIFKRRPGRPKKNRIPSTGEVKTGTSKGSKFAWLGREGTRMRCGNCNELGHNIRGCPRLRQNTEGTQAERTQTPHWSENVDETWAGNRNQTWGTHVNETEAPARQRRAKTSKPTGTKKKKAPARENADEQAFDIQRKKKQAPVDADPAQAQRFRRAYRAQLRRFKKQQARAAAAASDPSTSRKRPASSPSGTRKKAK